MSVINQQAFRYVNAREQEKQRQEKARTAAILRTMNAESAQLRATKLKLTASRITLIAAIAFNAYAAVKGWRLL